MYVFTDVKGERVELTFGPNPYQMTARHVLLLLKYKDKWLLTKHRTRGIEFPGGKVENGESVEAAIIRETYEETGVVIENVRQFAEYVVHSDQPFCKAVFTGEVVEIRKNPVLYETKGAVWFTDEQLNECNNLSFYMLDEGMERLRRWVDSNAEKWKD